MKSCKTCKWWKDEEARSKGGRLIRERVAPCLYPVDEIKVPESHPHHGRAASLRYMTHYYGTDCDCYEKKN